jgi:methionyl-tRNA synthetase
MSKSSGNVRDPVSYERAFGPDVLRYFVMREVVYGLDGDFSEERLIERYNADLANDLGNLTSRVLTMAHRYCGGEAKAAPQRDDRYSDRGARIGAKPQLSDEIAIRVTDELDFKAGLEAIWEELDRANKYVVATEPFKLAKDPGKADEVAQVLANLLETIRVVADALEPFMPVTSRKIFDLLNADQKTAHAAYGEGLKPGHKINPPVALFPRIEKTANA